MSSYALIGDSQAIGLRPYVRDLMLERGYAEMGFVGEVGRSTGATVASNEVANLLFVGIPDLVLVVLGGNDQLTNEANKMAELAAQVHGAYEARGVPAPRIVWVGPVQTDDITLNAQRSALSGVQLAAARALEIDWLSGQVLTQDLQHREDGIHFPATSLHVFADRLVASVFASRSAGVLRGLTLGLVGASLGTWLAIRS